MNSTSTLPTTDSLKVMNSTSTLPTTDSSGSD